MTEKRRHRRHSLMFKVIYSNAENPQRRTETTSTDISLGGIGLKIKKLVKENEKLNLKIYKPSSKIPIRAKGTLIWQDRLRGRAGVRFTAIGWSEIKALV